jgi:5-methylthioadenosine/S-adenosylhomocysteine deaminase
MSDRQDNPSDKQPTHADLRIDAGWVVPVEPAGAVLRAHSLLLRDGLIAALLPTAQAGQWQCAETLALPDHALLPGLVNTHGHAAMSLLRGYADDLPLMPWLQEHIWPAEAAHVSRGFVRDGTQLAMAEMLRAGTTTFSDMYFFPEVVASLAQGAGMRCQLSFPVFDFPTAWGSGADEYISKGLALRDDCKSRDLADTSPSAPTRPTRSARRALRRWRPTRQNWTWRYRFTCTKPRARYCRRWRPTVNAPLTPCVASASWGRARSACT